MLLEVPTVDGTLTAGGYLPAVDGMVRNLWVRRGQAGGFLLSFDWEGLPEGDLAFWVYVDRRAVSRVLPGEVWSSGPLDERVHEVLLVVVRGSESGAPDVMGEVGGDQVFLAWNGVEAADLEAYVVYWDSGTGTVVYTAGGVFAELTRVTSGRLVEAAPSSGTGVGRLTVDGVWRGGRVNGVFAVEVTAAGMWQYDAGEGLNGTDIEIVSGVPLLIGTGLRAVFLDAVGDYEVGDRWEWFVGVESSLVSEPQASGTYKFAVKARDVAGNVSSASAEKSVALVAELEAPVSPAVVWDADAETVTLTWSAPDDVRVDRVRVYTNYDAMTNGLNAGVIEEWHWQEADVEDEGLVLDLTSKPRGRWLFYLRSVDGDGNWERNATLLSVAVADEVPAVLAVVTITEGVAGVGGKVSLEHVVERSDGDPALLNVYVGDSADWDALTLVESVAFEGSGYPVSRGTWVSPGTYSGMKYFGMRAVDGDGNLGPVGNIVGVTADGTAPDAPTWGTAIAT